MTTDNATNKLIDDIGLVLAPCLQELIEVQPSDPITFIAHWLYNYASNRIYEVNKRDIYERLHAKSLEIRRQTIEKWKQRKRVQREYEMLQQLRTVLAPELRMWQPSNDVQTSKTRKFQFNYQLLKTIDARTLLEMRRKLLRIVPWQIPNYLSKLFRGISPNIDYSDSETISRTSGTSYSERLQKMQGQTGDDDMNVSEKDFLLSRFKQKILREFDKEHEDDSKGYKLYKYEADEFSQDIKRSGRPSMISYSAFNLSGRKSFTSDEPTEDGRFLQMKGARESSVYSHYDIGDDNGETENKRNRLQNIKDSDDNDEYNYYKERQRFQRSYIKHEGGYDDDQGVRQTQRRVWNGKDFERKRHITERGMPSSIHPDTSSDYLCFERTPKASYSDREGRQRQLSSKDSELKGHMKAIKRRPRGSLDNVYLRVPSKIGQYDGDLSSKRIIRASRKLKGDKVIGECTWYMAGFPPTMACKHSILGTLMAPRPFYTAEDFHGHPCEVYDHHEVYTLCRESHDATSLWEQISLTLSSNEWSREGESEET